MVLKFDISFYLSHNVEQIVFLSKEQLLSKHFMNVLVYYFKTNTIIIYKMIQFKTKKIYKEIKITDTNKICTHGNYNHNVHFDIISCLIEFEFKILMFLRFRKSLAIFLRFVVNIDLDN